MRAASTTSSSGEKDFSTSSCSSPRKIVKPHDRSGRKRRIAVLVEREVAEESVGHLGCKELLDHACLRVVRLRDGFEDDPGRLRAVLHRWGSTGWSPTLVPNSSMNSCPAGPNSSMGTPATEKKARACSRRRTRRSSSAT